MKISFATVASSNMFFEGLFAINLTGQTQIHSLFSILSIFTQTYDDFSNADMLSLPLA